MEERQAADPDGKWLVGSLTPKSESAKNNAVNFGFNDSLQQDPASARVFAHSLASGTFKDEFVVQLKGVADVQFWQGVRCRSDFEQLHEELGREHGGEIIQPLPNRTAEYFKMQPVVWSVYMHESSVGLEDWLNQVIDAGFGRAGSFKRFLSNQATQGPTGIHGWDSASHMILSLPMLDDVINFLEEPLDVAHLCELSSKTIFENGKLFCPTQWERMYAERWPAFHEAQCHMSEVTHMKTDWKSVYRHTCSGKYEALLEVYDREKKLGFAMSCMLAKVSWDANINCYITSYVSASQVLPEKIPYHEGHRLRFCRPSAHVMRRDLVQRVCALMRRKVLHDVPDLKVGQGLELQWKMQQGSPFGWWFGIVESVVRDPNSTKAIVTMTFDHFPATSRWRRLQITVGDGATRPCAIGGWHGGVRAVSPSEKKEWAKFFPKVLLLAGLIQDLTELASGSKTLYSIQDSHVTPGLCLERNKTTDTVRHERDLHFPRDRWAWSKSYTSGRRGYGSKLPPGGLPPIVRAPETLLGQSPRIKKTSWNVGHDAMSAASVWLDNVASQGKRIGDRVTDEPVLYKGDVSLRDLRKFDLPVRRLIASTGALTARELHKASRTDEELFQPLNKVRACEGLASSKGNGLFAKRSLLEDELLFEEDPVCGMAMLMFDDASSEGFCQHCLVWLREDSGKVFCPRKCGAPYCSHSCRDAAHWAYHDVLCPAANPRWAEYVQRAQECGNEYYVLAARALASLRNCVPVPVPQGDAWQQTPWLGYAAPPWWQTMKRPVYDTDDESDSAASSSEDLDSEANASLDRFFQSAVRTQTSEMAEELSAVLSGSSAAIASLLAGPEALGRLMGLVRVNSMAVQSQCYEDSEDGLAKGMAIYPVTSAMNHDVESNCYVASNPLEPQRCYVRTRRPVAAGEEEREMKVILQLISEKAAQKFNSIRSALRHLDADCDGNVDRSEDTEPIMHAETEGFWMFAAEVSVTCLRYSPMTTRAAARQAVRSQYFFVANDEEAFSVFGRQEVQDINTIRQVTDVGYLVFFLLVLLLMAKLDADAVSKGNVLRLSEPIDFQGRLCGYDAEVKDKPLGYHPNPFNDMVICVSACPQTATDGTFTLPDGPMGKEHTRPAYPTDNIYGQLCLPLDLELARLIISVKSVQTEMYKALGVIFTSSDGILVVLAVPFVTSFIYLIALYYIPTAATTLAFSITAVTLALVGVLMDLDLSVMKGIDLFKETHPLMLMAFPYFRTCCYLSSFLFFLVLGATISAMVRAHAVFRECVAAIFDPNVLVTVFTSVALSVIRIGFILYVCRRLALLMSIVEPYQVELQLFGEVHFVERTAWSPFFLWGVFFYVFGTFWILEFLSFSNKYITAQILCANYFHLKARNLQMQEIGSGRPAPIRYALYSMFRFHLGSIARAALMSAPCRFLRGVIQIFVPDRPNLDKSLNQQYRIAFYLFWPLIQIDLYILRFYKDSVLVMLALKGFKYMDSARRVEGLLNRSRGKIPHLTKFTSRIEAFLKGSMGFTSMVWAFFLFREPRQGAYHQVETLSMKSSITQVWVTPEHSPLLAMPVLLMFGLWVGDGMLHLVTMSSNALTICYCIDVEMVGGTETDALYAPAGLKLVYRDLGGGESERELAELMANNAIMQ
ncbi:unnamed protein product [Symbiodinium sp. KB8]|nr:unnamed protein product [Symbiodinium sp. KB8]